MDKEYDVFISYRHDSPAEKGRNISTARSVKAEFEKVGCRVFIDQEDCTDWNFSNTIIPAIHSCRNFVVMLTQNSLDNCKNANDWVRREILEAFISPCKVILITPDGEVPALPEDLPAALSAISGVEISNIGVKRKTLRTDIKNLVETRLEFAGDGDNKSQCAEIQKEDVGKIVTERENQERREREGRGEFEVGGVEFKMVMVMGGSFFMGATYDQGGYFFRDNRKPVHPVTLNDYYIGETQVTWALWNAVMAESGICHFYQRYWPRFRYDDNEPVVGVSWLDIVEKFIPMLNNKTGSAFRLPTEAEWEFAARDGFKYSGSDNIDEVAWYYGNIGYGRAQPVKGKKANGLGLYDMSGNVWEWCHDWYGKYSSGAQINPQGPDTGSYRVLRGGSYGYSAECCRVSFRRADLPGDRRRDIGFRLVLCP